MAPPSPIYSHLAVIPPGWELLVLAGQIGADPNGEVKEGILGQLTQAVDNVAAILASESLDLNALVKLNLWLVGPAPIDAVRSVFSGRWRDPPPMTLAYVTALARPDILVEVEAWAAREPARRRRRRVASPDASHPSH